MSRSAVGQSEVSFHRSAEFLWQNLSGLPIPHPGTHPTMATDHEVTEEIRKYLDGADLEQVTQKTVRKHLAARFPGLDVSARKDFIKEQVVALLSPPAEPAAGHSKAGASSAATSRNGSSSAAAAAADEDEPTDIGKSDRSCKQVVPRHLQGAQSKSKKRKVCGEDGGVAGWRGGDAMGGCCVVGPGEFAPCRHSRPQQLAAIFASAVRQSSQPPLRGARRNQAAAHHQPHPHSSADAQDA